MNALSLAPTHAEPDAEQPVPPAEPPGTAPPKPGCTYELSSGLCGEKVRARGYCHNHYKVLARRKAFDIQQPAWGTATVPANVRRNQRALDKAKSELEKAAPLLVSHLITASERAAMKGKSGPAEFGLLHSRAIEPVKAAQPAASQGVKVYVGFSLGTGQLPAPGRATDHAGAIEAQVIEQDE